jgi:DNA polymerase-3 subunit delta
MSVHGLLQETGPVRILCGDDPFAIDECLARFRSVFESGNFPELNVERFYGDERGAEALEDAARSMPAFAEGRLVVWRGHSKAQGSKMLTKLLSYLEKPNPSTLLVLVLPGDPDGRLKAVKAVKKMGFLSRFEPLKEADAALWLTGLAKDRGTAMDSRAASHLVAALGCDRHALSQALEKLDLFADGERIDSPMIDQVVSPVLDEDVWALADLLARGRLAEALTLMQRLLDDQRRGHELVPGLAYRFRSLARMLGAQAARVPTNQMSKVAGVPPWDLRRSAPLLKNWTAPRMRLALDALHRADDRLKGGWAASERATLEALCLELCSV